MTALNEFIFLLIVYAGGVISSTFGIGGAFIIIPLSALLLPIKKAIVILTVFFLVNDTSKAVVFRKYIDWRAVLLLWIGAIPGVILGAYSLVIASPVVVERILGAIILAYVVNSLFGLTKHLKLSDSAIVVGGFGYGFFAGIIGTGGPIKAAILIQLGLRKEKFIATMSSNAVLLNIIKMAIYSKYSLILRSEIMVMGFLVLVAVIAALTGKFFVKKITPNVFERIVMSILLISGIKLLFF